MEEIDQLIAMADMYASSCTRQQEKYESFQRRGYTWRWEDCEAAYDLIRELPDYWTLVEDWRFFNKCHSCGFPINAHSVHCRLVGDPS
jgi:hypothetical protein